MKKLLTIVTDRDKFYLKKTILIMKLATFLLMANLIHLTASVTAQNERFTIKEEKIQIRELFDQIESESEYKFLYRSDYLVDKYSAVNAENMSIDELLGHALSETGLKYAILENQLIVITPETANNLQQILVTGTIRDASTGEPLIGVNVIVEGTTQGVVSDATGKYSIAVESTGSVLVFSYLGYLAASIPVNNQTTIDVTLVPDIKALDEVVVVGYGSQLKREITGNQTNIKADDLKSIPFASVDAALQGKSTGLDISSPSGGQINGLVKVRVRGIGSINSGTQPLWVVDGIPVMADEGGSRSLAGDNGNDIVLTPSINYLADLNFNDVESVTVLKDAAATAIYGSRGSNGVILVTTKSGKEGKGKVEFNYNRTTSHAINQIELMNGQDWIETNQQAWLNDGRTGSFPLPVNALFDDTLRNGQIAYTSEMMNSTNTDWMDEMLQTGIIDDYSLALSNGTKNTSYFISGNYSNSKGILKGTELKRYSIRTNLDFQPLKWLKAGTRSGFSGSSGFDTPISGGGGGRGQGRPLGYPQAPGYGSAFNLPVYPVKYEDGSWFEPNGLNSVSKLSTKDRYFSEYKTQHLVGMVFLELQLMKGLTLRSEAGLDYFKQPYQSYWHDESRGGADTYWEMTNYTREGTSDAHKTNYNAVLNYNRNFNDKHNLNLTLGTERTITSYYTGYWQNWNVLTTNNLNGPTSIDYDNPNTARFFSDKFQEKFEGYFGRINYSLLDRYILGFSIRRDGSNKFGPDNRYGTFPSLSAGWIISDESFFTNDKINLLKLRGSIGQTGNSNIAMYKWQNVYAPWAYYNDEQWLSLLTLGNRSIQWEKSNVIDLGIEFAMFNNRISGTLAYYNKSTSNMLLNVTPVPSVPSGVDPTNRSIVTNAGEIRNSGFEISISTINVVSGDFRWTTDFNFSTNQNKIIALDETLAPTPFSISGDTKIAIAEGHPLGEYVLTQFAGYTDKGDDLIYAVDQDKRTESNQFELVKVAGDSTVLATASNIDANRFYTGKTGIPTFYGGMNNSFYYKGLSLDIFFSFKGGHYIYLNNGRYTSAGENAMTTDLINNAN
jgi:TonB-linked SusC/RagA family outer membrane protein